MLPWFGRYLIGDYFMPPEPPIRPRPSTLPRNFGMYEHDGIRVSPTGFDSDQDDEIQRMIEETRIRSEKKREEDEKRHQARMRALMMTEDEPVEAERVLLEKRSEMKERQKEEDARIKLEQEKKLKEAKEFLEKEKIEEEKRKKEFQMWREAQDERWKIRDSETNKICEEAREATNEEMERIENENADILRQSEQEANQMKEDFRNRLRQEKEQNEHAYGEYCNRLRAQMGFFMRLVQHKEWTRKMEEKWGDRLNGLKEWFIPIAQSFSSLKIELDSKEKLGKFDLKASERSKIKATVDILLERLETMEKVMENESEDMERMAEEHPEATFLADIQESAWEVGQAVSKMMKNIQMFKKGIHKNCSHMDKWNRCVSSFDNLNKKVDVIPTVNELKEKHERQIRAECEEENESVERSVPVSSLIITELD